MSSNLINRRRINKLFVPNKKIVLYSKDKKTYKEIQTIILRFYIQTLRRPAIILISIIQPLLWLIMFGALFQNAPIYLFEEYKIQYRRIFEPRDNNIYSF